MSFQIIRLDLGPMGTNTYLLASAGEVAVIDPGFEAGEIVRRIEELKPPPRVKCIVNTHGHIDHMGANAALKAATGAPILIGAGDAAQLTNPDANLSVFIGAEVVSPPADRVLREGDIVEVGDLRLKVIETPGHTEGGICLLGDGFAFTGDTLFFASMGRTDFPGGSERKIFASLKRLKELLPDETMVYPGHEEPGLMRDIKRVNPFLS